MTDINSIITYLKKEGVGFVINAIFLFVIYKFLMKKLNQTPCAYTPEIKKLIDKVTIIETRVNDLSSYFRAWLNDMGIKYKGRDDD